ncbi:hypothetical protein F9502_24330, partial [Escherichia coli]|nr:hypothetical protein [Escherichia coli]
MWPKRLQHFCCLYTAKKKRFSEREALHWAVTTGCFDSETIQDVMPRAVERRFGSELP